MKQLLQLQQKTLPKAAMETTARLIFDDLGKELMLELKKRAQGVELGWFALALKSDPDFWKQYPKERALVMFADLWEVEAVNKGYFENAWKMCIRPLLKAEEKGSCFNSSP